MLILRYFEERNYLLFKYFLKNIKQINTQDVNRSFIENDFKNRDKSISLS